MRTDIYGNELPKGVYQTKDKLYRGQFVYKKKRFNVSSKNLDVCIRRMERLKYELENNITIVSKKMTVDKWYNVWFKTYKKPSVKRSTAILYEEIYERNIKPLIGKYYLEEVRGGMIQQIYSSMYEKNCAKNSIEVCRSVMNGLFEQAVKEELIISNPVKKATMPKARVEKEKVMMSKEQQQIFLQYVNKSRLRNLILLAMYTGMRSGEIRGLQWNDIDLENKVIHVNHTINYNNGEYYLDEPKTKSSKRDIPMIMPVIQLLNDVHKNQTMKSTYKNMEHLVFVSPTGYPINTSMVKNKLDTIVRKIQKQYSDFPDMTFHSLRHLFATRCIEAGMPFNVLQKILGHNRLSQTMDLYAHVLPDTKRKEMMKVEEVLTCSTAERTFY